MTADRRVDQPTFNSWAALDKRKVRLLHRSCGKLGDKPFMGSRCAGNYQHAGGVLIQSMHHPRSVPISDRRNFGESVHKLIGESLGRLPGTRMHYQSLRLIDDHNVIVAIEQWHDKRFGLHSGCNRFGQIDRNGRS